MIMGPTLAQYQRKRVVCKFFSCCNSWLIALTNAGSLHHLQLLFGPPREKSETGKVNAKQGPIVCDTNLDNHIDVFVAFPARDCCVDCSGDVR